MSIFRNLDLLTNIQNVNTPLCLTTIGGGKQITHQMGNLECIGDVWYNPDSIANILSLSQPRKVRRITMDTELQPAFHVHSLDGKKTTVFANHGSGLYLHDTSLPTHKENSKPVINFSCLQTVSQNKQLYTKRQIELANEACKLHHLIGRPSLPCFLNALENNHLLNCPITVDDGKRAEHIYSKDVAFLKGKKTSSPITLTPVPSTER